MKHRFALLCERTSVDRETNNLSAFNIIEELTVEYTGSAPSAANKQMIAQPFTLTILTERSDLTKGESGTMRVSFVDNLGDDLMSPIDVQVDLQNHLRTRSNIKSNAFQVTGDGVYKFIIEFQNRKTGNWKKVATTPLLVKVRPAAKVSKPAAAASKAKPKKAAPRKAATKKAAKKAKKKGNGKTR